MVDVLAPGARTTTVTSTVDLAGATVAVERHGVVRTPVEASLHAAGAEPVLAGERPDLRVVAVGPGAEPGDRRRATSSEPALLVVEHGVAADVAAALAVDVAAAGVVSAAAPVERLVRVAHGVLSARRHALPSGTSLAVGGVAGGVGTSTVAAALAAWSAWTSGHTLLVARRATAGAPLVPPDALTSSDAWSLAAPLPGVARLRCVVCPDATAATPVSADRRVVVDVGVDEDCSVLVVRPDRDGLDAARRTSAGRLLVRAGRGPVRPRDVLAAAPVGGGVVPHDPRVQRAAMADRLPGGLPGTWLRHVAQAAAMPATGRPPSGGRGDRHPRRRRPPSAVARRRGITRRGSGSGPVRP